MATDSETPDDAAADGPAPAITTPLPSVAGDETLPSVEETNEQTTAEPVDESSDSPAQPDAAATLPGDSDSPPATEDVPLPSAPRRVWARLPGSRGVKIALVSVAALLILSVTGGGALYALTRPQPSITVTSQYQVGNVPAGATTTTLHVEGKQFSGYSAIILLLDGQPAPGSQVVPSDVNGTFEADLLVTARWKLGAHQLTARDASGYTTGHSVKVMVVAQGQADTSGPNGAPPDDTALFNLYLTLFPQGTLMSTAGVLRLTALGGSDPNLLTVRGQPDPAGGTVCNTQQDDGQAHTSDFSIGTIGTISVVSGIVYRPVNGSGPLVALSKLTTAYTCSGVYQGAKISYTETNTTYKEVYSDGSTCGLAAPRVSFQLQGAFTSATTAAGTYSSPTTSLQCSKGHSETLGGEQGMWLAQLLPA
jgi:hypothetical protein